MMATQEVEQAIASTTKDNGKKKPGPNNPEEASKFVEVVEQSMTSVLDIIEDKQCKILLQPSIHEAEEQKLCSDPRVSTDNIPTGH